MNETMKYRTIVVDPPWQYRKGSGVNPERVRNYAEDHYPTMPMSEIASLPIGAMADVDAHLYLWVTCPRLYHDRNDHRGISPYDDIVRGWGFEYRTLLTWVKGSKVGMGAYYRIDTEHVLFCVRGNAPIAPSKRLSSVFVAARTRHSEKPAMFYDYVEQVSPAPRLDVFARQQRFGWDTWGNECFSIERGDA